MKRIQSLNINVLTLTVLLINFFTLCRAEAQTYRDIPGVTPEEIRDIEALREQKKQFSYGMIFSGEAFYYRSEYQSEELMGGYAPRFCRRMTELFGIPFLPELYSLEELIDRLETMTVDFSGELTRLEEDEQYYATDPIARRMYKSFRLAEEDDFFHNSGRTGRTDTPRYGFLANSPSLALIPPLLQGRFIVVTFRDYEEAYTQLKTGKIDLFFADESKEAVVEQYPDVRSDYFLPQIQRLVVLSTRNTALSPIISVTQKYLDNGGFEELLELYHQGREDYERYRFLRGLTSAEVEYLNEHRESPIKAALQYDNYPVSFYNEQDHQWQGIVPDLLQEITELTGMNFEIINSETEERARLLDKVATGEASIIAELIHSPDRESRYIWAETPYLRDWYVLISRSDYPEVSIDTLIYTRIGSVAESVYAQTFKNWFPQHSNFIEYRTYMESFDALEKGEVDLLMMSGSLLLMITNYYERPGFKVNFVFDQPCDSQFGFNKGETTLRGIIDKAQQQINTNLIADRWSRRVFDYRGKLARGQVPYLFGASALLSILLILITVLLLRTRYLKIHLEETVRTRTQELEIQSNLAKSASKAKSRFLASMSHEIRTPMNVIIGMSDLMRTDNLDEVQLNYFMNIKKMSKALLQIINDILDFSKIEAGKLELLPVHYNIFALFDNICSMIRFTAMGKEIEFRQCFDPAIPEAQFGDEVRIRQVITNILSNAVKYTSKGFVDFQMRRIMHNGKDCFVCIVEDTGRGIKQEDFPKIFGAFQQVDSDKNRGIVGTGLGLSITRNLVRMMGGEITFESEYGKGSIFRVYLPIIPGDPEKIEYQQTSEWLIAKENAAVLVVDDNAINVTVALGFLSAHNIQADTASNGREAVEKVREKNYDLVFMDHMMPEMDGVEASRIIRSFQEPRFKTMPIIALSANAVSGARETFIAGGINDFLPKPIEADQLNLILTRWLPSEKIAEITRPGKNRSAPIQAADEYDSLLKELGEIGLNTTAGLSHIANNKPGYIKILRQFCAESDAYCEAILKFFKEENWKEYGIRVHGMKGAYANIGAEELAKQAYTLESAAKHTDYDACRANTEAFCKAMMDFKNELSKTALMCKTEISLKEKTSGTQQILFEKLSDLEEACTKANSASAESIIDELNAMLFDNVTNTSIKKIANSIESLDYDMALEEIREMLHKV
jgi:signal transduction histidine kinase/CheY-like chemotaxis protein